MNILYLFPKLLYERKMSLGRVLYGKAVGRQPGVDLRVWGPGWEGWNDSQTVAQNCARQFGADWLEVLWSYKASEHKPGVGAKLRRSIVCFNEAHDPLKTKPDIVAADATDVVFHHETDLQSWSCLRNSGVRTHHVLHCIDASYFQLETPVGFQSRPESAIVSGIQAPKIYPLRARFAELIRQGRISGSIRKHPGYRLPSAESCDSQYVDYVSQLSRSKVSLCCTSRFRYPLAKIVESLAAGCVTVTDFPSDSLWVSQVGPFCCQVSALDSDEKLVSVVTEVESETIRDQALAGQRWVLQNLTTDQYAQRLIACLQ